MNMTFKKSLFLIIISFVFIFVSCKNLNDSLTQTKKVILKGNITVEGAAPSEIIESLTGSKNTNTTARSASINPDEDDFDFYIHATNASGYSPNDVKAETSGGKTTFEIALDYGKWTLYSYAKSKSDNQIYFKSSSYTQTINEDTSILNHSFVVRPLTDGEGSIDLEMEVEAPVGTTITGYCFSEELFGKVVAKKDFSSEPSGNLKLKINSVKSGTYKVQLVFIDNTKIVYTSNQIINVYKGLTTDTWINNGGSDDLITNGVFKLTSRIINNFEMYTFYVDSEIGDDNNQGTVKHPFKTVEKAIQQANASGSPKTKNIYVKANPSGEEINSTLNLSKDFNIEVYTDRPGDKKGKYSIKRSDAVSTSIIEIPSSTTIVSLTGLIINGQNKTNDNHGCGINNQGTLTLNNCEIINNKSTSSINYGAGIYTNNKLTINDTLIYGNSTSGKGSGIYFADGDLTITGSTYFDKQSDIYVCLDKSITVSGTLAPINEIGKSVTTTAYLTFDNVTVGTTIAIVKQGASLDLDTANKFIIISNGIEGKYCIEPDTVNKNNGILAECGAGVSPEYTPKTYKISINKAYKLPGVEEEITLSVTDSNNKTVEPTSCSLKLIQSGTTITTSTTNKITVPSWLPEGNYTIRAEIVIDGIKYDREFVFVVARILPIGNESDFSKYIDFPDIYLTDDVVFKETLEKVSLTDNDSNNDRDIITKIDNLTKNIYGNGTALVTNTSNNKKITVNDADYLFLYAVNNSVVEINNIDFTATQNTLSKHNYNGIFARAESGAVITFNYCTLSDFWEESNGAGSGFVAESGGKLIFNNCTFSDFSTYKRTGCSPEVIKVYKDSSCEIYDCSFTGIGTKTSCASNASLTNHGDMKIYRTTFDKTYGQEGGAIQNNNTLYAEDVIFKNGKQISGWYRNCGAGMKLNAKSVRAEFVRCTFEGNITSSGTTHKPLGGGGIAVLGNTAIFDSCTFKNNTAGNNSDSYGGAIWLWNGENASDAVLDVTFKDNGSVISVENYITKYMSGNTVSGQTDHGANIYLLYDGNEHGTVKINGTEYKASKNWE